jgi:hypothetical protein
MNVEVQDLWIIQEQLRYVKKINRKELKNPKDKKGIVSTPLIPFIQPQDYIFPLLHFKIGAVNNVLESLQNYVEDQVEIISDTEKVARNRDITADVAYTRLKDTVHEAHATIGIQQLRLQKTGLSQMLRQRGLTEEQIGSLVAERRQIDERIAALQTQKESMERELGQKRKSLSEARKELKKNQSDKTKIDLPTVAGIENIFLNYYISPAAYHGGKLNGVDCREVMAKAAPLFNDFQQLLLLVRHPEWSSEDITSSRMTIENVIKEHKDICTTLDIISSKLRMKQGTPLPTDQEVLQ